MALNWDATAIPDYDELKTDEEWAKTNALIWLTIVVQYGWDLTDKNLDKAWERIYAFQKVTGNSAYTKWNEETQTREDYYLTYADLKRRVGLRTNSGEMTDAAWKKHLMTIINREASRAKS